MPLVPGAHAIEDKKSLLVAPVALAIIGHAIGVVRTRTRPLELFSHHLIAPTTVAQHTHPPVVC